MGDGETVQRTEETAVSGVLICLFGPRRGVFGSGGDDRVHPGIDALDLAEVSIEEFARGEVLRAGEARHFGGGEQAEIIHAVRSIVNHSRARTTILSSSEQLEDATPAG